jgi:hypothetical protein
MDSFDGDRTGPAAADTTTAQKRVVFIHLGKTAGTSLRTALSEAFPGDTICPELFDGLSRYSPAELAGYRLFAGHFRYSTLRHIPGRFDVITMLREPSARLLSFFYFIRSHKLWFLEQQFPDVACVKRMSLDKFLSEGAPQFQSAVDQLGDGDLELAKQRIAAMAAVGLQERSELSRRLIERQLDIRLRVLPRENVTGNRRDEDIFESEPMVRETLTDIQSAHIAELTAADRELWRFARRRFNRDVARELPGIAVRLVPGSKAA